MPDPSRKKPVVETRGHQHVPPDPREEKAPLHAQFDEPPKLTRDTLAAYNQSHNRLLIGLTLVLTFLLSCFAISDSDVFFSLQTGRLIAHGQFPWGEDPYGYADAAGEHAPWVHPGWLGDLAIYGLYEWGGGPLLVLTRAAMMMVLFYLLFQLGNPGPRRYLSVLAGALGVLTLSQRFYLRTELFSYFLLGLTFWCLSARPAAVGWAARLNRLTAGRPYWVLPLVMLLWVNLDAWFFLGVVTVVVWFLFLLVNPGEGTAPGEVRSLGVVAALCVLASFCSPYHVDAWRQFRTQLFPPTGMELLARFDEAVRQNPSASAKAPEQTRSFMSPWVATYFQPTRQDVINRTLAVQDPLLPLVYPNGLSLSEWAYYPLVVLSILSLLSGAAWRRWERVALLLVFLALGTLQSRLLGFFAVAGAALTILNFQTAGPRVPSLGRARVLFGQLARLALGLVLQVLSLLMLIPSPDASPSPLGHIHARGHFGFAFRIEPGTRGVEEQLAQWRQAGQLPGRTFHLDWADQAAYDAWFNPGARHFFDRRYEVHSPETVKAFFAAVDALGRPGARNRNEQLTPAKLTERRKIWEALFRQHDVSNLVVRRRFEVSLVNDTLPALMADRDEDNQPIWKPLRYHDGTNSVLAWTGSPHWPALQALKYEPTRDAFRPARPVGITPAGQGEGGSLGAYLWGDAPRRPSGVGEAEWFSLYEQLDPDTQSAGFVASQLLRSEIGGGLLLRLGGQLVTPTFQPPIPLVLPPRPTSGSTALLALQAARRAVAQLSPEASTDQRADVWETYLGTVLTLSEFESGYAPNAPAFRDPLRLFVLRQAALANDAAGRRMAQLQHLELARIYYGRRAFDEAYEHYQSARSSFERNASHDENAQRLLQQFPGFVKKQAGFDPAELEAAWKRQLAGCEAEFTRAGLPPVGGTAREAVGRAAVALRYGLPNRAFEELGRAGTPSMESYYLACQVCMILGQFDTQARDYLLPHPELRNAFEAGDYENRVSLGWWCLGRPDLAADARKELGDMIDEQQRQELLVSSADLLFGTSPHRWGSAYLAVSQAQRAAGMNLSLAENRVAEALLRLEGGQPTQAAEIFRHVLSDVEPETAWRPLMARYYLQITGQPIDAPTSRGR